MTLAGAERQNLHHNIQTDNLLLPHTVTKCSFFAACHREIRNAAENNQLIVSEVMNSCVKNGCVVFLLRIPTAFTGSLYTARKVNSDEMSATLSNASM